MAKVYSVLNGFVGHGGTSVWLGEGDEYDENDPLVKANRHHFTDALPARVVAAAAVAESKARRRVPRV